MSDGPIKQLGINFGATGDRQAENGTLWLDYPNHSGGSPLNFPVKVTADKPQWFRVHSSKIAGEGLPWVSSSGIRDVQEIRIPLVSGTAKGAGEGTYAVRLYFAEPNAVASGVNVFDVSLQGTQVLSDFDVVREANGVNKSVVEAFTGVKAKSELLIQFTAKKGQSLISGVEVVAE